MPKLELIDENVRMVKAFKPLDKSEMQQLSGALSDKNKTALDLYFKHHSDTYAA